MNVGSGPAATRVGRVPGQCGCEAWARAGRSLHPASRAHAGLRPDRRPVQRRAAGTPEPGSRWDPPTHHMPVVWLQRQLNLIVLRVLMIQIRKWHLPQRRPSCDKCHMKCFER